MKLKITPNFLSIVTEMPTSKQTSKKNSTHFSSPSELPEAAHHPGQTAGLRRQGGRGPDRSP